MSVGILLISHPGIATAILDNANRIWQQAHTQIDILEVPFDSDAETVHQSSIDKINALDDGDGVLVLCDILGASPCNMTQNDSEHTVIRISGLNLPMLIKAYNYADKTLPELSDLVIEGSTRSILQLP